MGRLLGEESTITEEGYTRGGVILRREYFRVLREGEGTIYFTVFETMCCNSAEDMDVFPQLFKLLNVFVNRLVPHKKKLTSIYKRICPSTPPTLPPVTTKPSHSPLFLNARTLTVIESYRLKINN